MNMSDFVKGHVYRRDDLISAFKGSFIPKAEICAFKNDNMQMLYFKKASVVITSFGGKPEAFDI